MDWGSEGLDAMTSRRKLRDSEFVRRLLRLYSVLAK